MPVLAKATYNTGSYVDGAVTDPDSNLGCILVPIRSSMTELYIRPSTAYADTPATFDVYIRDSMSLAFDQVATGVTEYDIDQDDMRQINAVYVNITTETPDGMTGAAFAATAISVFESLMYFTKSSLYLYITQQQLYQFENMYHNCVLDAYKSAVGKLTAQIGNRFNMEGMLSVTDEEQKDDTIRWILQVLTVYNICAPSLNISEPLDMAYKEVYQTIQRLKGGMVSLEEPAPYRNDKYDSNVEVVTTRSSYIG